MRCNVVQSPSLLVMMMQRDNMPQTLPCNTWPHRSHAHNRFQTQAENVCMLVCLEWLVRGEIKRHFVRCHTRGQKKPSILLSAHLDRSCRPHSVPVLKDTCSRSCQWCYSTEPRSLRSSPHTRSHLLEKEHKTTTRSSHLEVQTKPSVITLCMKNQVKNHKCAYICKERLSYWANKCFFFADLKILK